MEMIRSSKHQFELVLHSTKTKKAFLSYDDFVFSLLAIFVQLHLHINSHTSLRDRTWILLREDNN
jgi:hypothetical protein